MAAIGTLPVLFSVGIHASRPSASAVGKGGLYSCTTHALVYQTDGSSWTTWATLGSSTGEAVATSTIWDAAGDLVQGTGADTAAKLTLGAAGTVVRSTGSTNAYAYPPGYEYDYVAKTSSTSVTATAAGSADTVVTGASVAYDGSTRVKVEFYSTFVTPTASGGSDITIGLFESTTEIGRLVYQTTAANLAQYNAAYGVIFLTPTNASHTYIVKAWVSSGTGTVGAGAAGAAASPTFMRITKA